MEDVDDYTDFEIPNVKRVTPQSKASCQDRLIRYYAKHSRKQLGLSKTRLANFLNLTNTICKRDLFLVLRKIKFNEPFDVLGIQFCVSSSTALYIFKRRIPQLAKQLAVLIDWQDHDMYKINNPNGASENLKSMVDHLVVVKQRKYFISCTPFGLINFVSCGYPVNMANQKMVEQSNFISELPFNADVMGPRKYKFLTDILSDGSRFLLWESFEQVVLVNYVRMKRIDKWVTKPMIVRVKHELRRFEILANSRIESKLLPILDSIMIVCAALCNLRTNLSEMYNPDCDVNEEIELEEGNEQVDERAEEEMEEEVVEIRNTNKSKNVNFRIVYDNVL